MPGVGEARRRVLQVADKRRLQRLGVHARRREAGEAVDLRAAERLPVADRGGDRGAELLDPAGQAADPALAARKVPTGRLNSAWTRPFAASASATASGACS